MTIEELCKRSYDTAVAKGWHEEPRSLGDVITLMHSEVSEALECWRDSSHKLEDVWVSEGGKPEIKLRIACNLADAMVFAGAICQCHKLDLEKAALLKMDYNDSRPHRHGGKRG